MSDNADDDIPYDTQFVALNQLVSKCISNAADDNPNDPLPKVWLSR